MFRAIKLVVSLAALAGFVWFGFTVPLGERTLFGHVRAIAGSSESQRLVDGTRQKAVEVSRDVTQLFGDKQAEPGAAGRAPAPEAAREAAPADRLTAEDRAGMKKLIGSTRERSAP